MAAARSRRYVKSGSTRSIPSMSVVGNRRPVSTTTIRPSYSSTIMFLPISPRPPSGRTRSWPLIGYRRRWPAPPTAGLRLRAPRSRRGDQHAVALEHRADDRQFGVVQRHVGQARPSGLDADQLKRGLDRARRWSDRHIAVDVLQALIDLTPA